jgi:hypothetical protein
MVDMAEVIFLIVLGQVVKAGEEVEAAFVKAVEVLA